MPNTQIIMGLDMYINMVNRTDDSIETIMNLENDNPRPENPALAKFLPLRKYEFLADCYSIFHKVGYWRKANAIHGWFVEEVQKGIDDCGFYEITREHLETLKTICEEALATAKTDKIQPRGGFFFGSTATDGYYWDDIKSTIKQLKSILKMNWENNRFFYHSSW